MVKKFIYLALILTMTLMLGRTMAISAESSDSQSSDSQSSPGSMPHPTDHMNAILAGEVSPSDPGFYIVLFDTQPLALYDGSIPGLAATSPELIGAPRLDITTADSLAYLTYLETSQAAMLDMMSGVIGRTIEVAFTYQYALNGVAVWLDPAEVPAIAALDGVMQVERERIHQVQTDFGPEWIGADSVWDGSKTPDNIGTLGDGIVIGVIDSGINLGTPGSPHPSYVDNPPDDPVDPNHDFTNPYPDYLGECAGNPVIQYCTDKLVGIYDPTDTTPEDTGTGHGSHTSSTAGGNFVEMTDGNVVKGVAPHANLIMYKGCAGLNCLTLHTNAAIDQATANGVDAINYSIGGDSFDPYSDSNAQAFLGAHAANIMLAVAAGNDGDGAATIGSPSNAPWVASVAATTHNETGLNAADRLASFSSRGPDATLPDVLKPDIGAPGRNIRAALGKETPSGYGQISGTSMASPHYAGSMALIRALHPDWTAAEVRSAIMTTAYYNQPADDPSDHIMYKNEDNSTTPADPHDIGSGRVNLRAASLAGFVLNETAQNFLNANPAQGGDVTTLNLASFSDGSCAGRCVWTRTLRSTQDSDVTWTASPASDDGLALTVEPSVFTLSANSTQSICVTADVTTFTPKGSYAFGRINLIPDDPSIPTATFPVAVLAQNGDGSDVVCIEQEPPVPSIPTTLFFHGNTDEGCSGDGATDVGAGCLGVDGPMLLPKTDADDGIAARFGPNNTLLDNTEPRGTNDPNWTWTLTETVRLQGAMPLTFWYECGSCNLALADDFIIRLHADNALAYEQRIRLTTGISGVPTRLSTTLSIGEMITATNQVVLTIDSVYINQNPNTIYYDSEQPCNPAMITAGPCDSHVILPVVDDSPQLPSLGFVQQVFGVDENAGSADLTVALSTAALTDVTVDFATATLSGENAATPVDDFTMTTGSVTIPMGEITGTVSIPITEDLVQESNESFTVELSNFVGANPANSLATVTINDTSPLPELSIADATVSEAGGTATLTVTMSSESTFNAEFSYDMTDGTATAAEDYQTGESSERFGVIPAGQTSTLITVPITDDLTFEDAETFTVTMATPARATIVDADGIVTINDNDAAPVLDIADVTVDEDVGTAVVTVTLTGKTGKTATVDYATSDGTAVAGSDYTADTGTLTFLEGETEKTIAIAITDDGDDEDTELFNVTLSNPSEATIGDGSADVRINDNDEGVYELSISDATVDEDAGTATLTVTLSTAALNPPITVDYATSDDSALAGSDYSADSGTLTFGMGETEKTISIAITDDALDEDAETFNVTLSNATGTDNPTLADDQGVVAITDNDDPPTLSIADVTVGEGGGTATVVVTLSGASSKAIEVSYATADGSADSNDYTAAGGTLMFAAGEMSQSFDVTINDDFVDENDQAFTATLSNPTNATILDGNATITITDNDDPPTVSIVDVTPSEDVGTVAVNVNLSFFSEKTITVTYATSDGSAEAGSDYTAATGTVTFLPGEFNQSFDITINDDVLDEDDETINATLSNAINATILDGTATVTITDNDDAPTLSIADVTVSEADGSATLDVMLSAASGKTITVTYGTSDDTATAGDDYTAATGTLVFAAGETSKSFAVAISDDAFDEDDEALTATLSSPENATILDGEATVTITDNDDPPALSAADVTVDEGDGLAVITVTLSAASGKAISVDYATSNGTATAGSDYSADSGTLNFAAGETTRTFSVVIADDVDDENAETFNVTLSNAGNATIADDSAVVTINDNDAGTYELTISDATVDEAAGMATVTVTLSADAPNTITVDYATSDGTATAGNDYTTTSGTLTFNAGETEKTVTVTISEDTLDEDDETLNVDLSNATGTDNPTIADAQGVITITDNDDAPTLSVGDETVDEAVGNATVTVTLSAASSKVVTVDYATSDDSATAGDDYTTAAGTLTFNAGETTKTIAIPVSDDTLDEMDETLTVTLSNESNATILDGTATVTITDNDDAPTLSIADVTVNEGDGTATVQVTLSAASGKAVSADFTTTDGSATAGDDYTTASGTLNFAAGEMSKSIIVTITDDLLDEDDETLTVDLSNPSNATIADDSATVTITDNDDAPTLSIADVTVSEADGTATVTVTLNTASSKSITVDYATGTGTATVDDDYTAASGTLTFAAGETTQTFSVTISDDALDEDDETVPVTLSNATNAGISTNSATITIADDDATPTVSIDNVAVSVSEGDGTAVISVTLSAESSFDVTIDYTTVDGTRAGATAGEDYTAANGTLTIPAGQLTASVSITILDDAIAGEGDETFDVVFSNPSRASFAAADTATVTISDNEVPTAVALQTMTSTKVTIGWLPPLTLVAALMTVVSIRWVKRW